MPSVATFNHDSSKRWTVTGYFEQATIFVSGFRRPQSLHPSIVISPVMSKCVPQQGVPKVFLEWFYHNTSLAVLYG